MRVVIIVFGVLLCSAAIAEPQPWMKKDNPDTLPGIVFIAPKCGVTTAEIREIVDGILIRSRLRPGDYLTGTDGLGFVVKVDCLNPIEHSASVQIDIYFVRNILGRILLEAYPAYGSFGVADSEEVNKSIRDGVEDLVTDYLQANFDLTPE